MRRRIAASGTRPRAAIKFSLMWSGSAVAGRSVWHRLGPCASATAYWLAIYGTFANWAATLLAAAWGAGSTMPIAAGSHQGTATQETMIMVLLFSLSFALVAECGLVLWGLRGAPASEETGQVAGEVLASG